MAEGIENVDEKLERFRQEVKEEIKETRSMIKFPMPNWIGGLPQSRVKFYVFEETNGSVGDSERVIIWGLSLVSNTIQAYTEIVKKDHFGDGMVKS